MPERVTRDRDKAKVVVHKEHTTSKRQLVWAMKTKGLTFLLHLLHFRTLT